MKHTRIKTDILGYVTFAPASFNSPSHEIRMRTSYNMLLIKRTTGAYFVTNFTAKSAANVQ